MVLLSACVAFSIQGVQRLDAPWSKASSWMPLWCMAPCLSLLVPIRPHHVHSRSSNDGMAHPSKAASRLPKVRCSLRAEHDQAGCACVINRLWPGRISYPAARDLIQPLSGVTIITALEPNKLRLSWTVQRVQQASGLGHAHVAFFGYLLCMMWVVRRHTNQYV